MIKKIASIIMIILYISTYFCVYATPIEEYKSQIKDIEASKKETEENLKEITAEKNNIQNQVEELNESITTVQAELSDLEDDISSLDESIKVKKQDLESKQTLLDERLSAVYMQSGNTYLEALFSGGFINFLSNYDMIKQIAEYDNKLINEVKETKQTLESEKSKLEESKKQVEEKQKELKRQKSEREEKVKSLTQEQQAAQAIIEQKDSEIAKMNAAVKKATEEAERKAREEAAKKAREEAAKKAAEEAAKKENNKNNSSSSSNSSNNNSNNSSSNNSSNNSNNNSNTTNSSASMTWPTRLTHKVNSVYAPGGRSDTSAYVGTKHKGLDIYAPEGAPIYAAKSGTVVYVNYSGYGGGWGLYVVIYHGTDSKGQAIYTRYAHASRIASGISVGTKVTTNTVIMYSGNTGASEGAHLHFEVCLKNMYNQVNPCPYLGITNTRGNH